MNNVPARELDLISAAQRGDISAFNQLVRAYQELAYRLAFHVLDHAGAAEQATQNAFETAYRTIKHWKGQELKQWLLQIVVRECSRSTRGARFRAPRASSFPQSPIEMGLAVLAPDERVICILSDVIGLDDREIAQITGADVTTVRIKRSRARLQVRNVLHFAGTAHPKATGRGRR